MSPRRQRMRVARRVRRLGGRFAKVTTNGCPIAAPHCARSKRSSSPMRTMAACSVSAIRRASPRATPPSPAPSIAVVARFAGVLHVRRDRAAKPRGGPRRGACPSKSSSIWRTSLNAGALSRRTQPFVPRARVSSRRFRRQSRAGGFCTPGGAYYAEKRALARYIEETCIAKAAAAANGGTENGANGSNGKGKGNALTRWRHRGATGPRTQRQLTAGDGGHHRSAHRPVARRWLVTGTRMGALALRCPIREVDTFCSLRDVARALMREPFAPVPQRRCTTPVNAVPCRRGEHRRRSGVIARRRVRSTSPIRFNHKRVNFARSDVSGSLSEATSIKKTGRFRIVPILAGLGAQPQASGNRSRSRPYASPSSPGRRARSPRSPGPAASSSSRAQTWPTWGRAFGDPRALSTPSSRQRAWKKADRASLDRAVGARRQLILGRARGRGLG